MTKLTVTACVIALATAAIPLTTLKVHRSAFDDSGRARIWRLMLEPWARSSRIPFGFGIGTSTPFLLHYQEQAMHAEHPGAYRGMAEVWDNMHSDFLQMLPEGGVVGAGLLVLFAAAALMRARRKSPALLAAAAALLASCIANPVIHWPVHALAGLLIMSMVFESDVADGDRSDL